MSKELAAKYASTYFPLQKIRHTCYDDIGGSCAGQTGRLPELPNGIALVVEDRLRTAGVVTCKEYPRYEIESKSIKLDDYQFLNIRATRVRNFRNNKVMGEWTYNPYERPYDGVEIPKTHHIMNQRMLTPYNHVKPQDIYYLTVANLGYYLDPEKEEYEIHRGWENDKDKFSRDDLMEAAQALVKEKIILTIISPPGRDRDNAMENYITKLKKIFELCKLKTLYEVHYNNRIHEGDTNYLTSIILKG